MVIDPKEIYEKQSFTAFELSSLVKRLDPNITGASYTFGETGEEYVYIFYRDGSFKRATVTADGLITMVRDVLRKVGERV